jgi:hypothetical protein
MISVPIIILVPLYALALIGLVLLPRDICGWASLKALALIMLGAVECCDGQLGRCRLMTFCWLCG